jgi:hypothetical protein
MLRQRVFALVNRVAAAHVLTGNPPGPTLGSIGGGSDERGISRPGIDKGVCTTHINTIFYLEYPLSTSFNDPKS